MEILPGCVVSVRPQAGSPASAPWCRSPRAESTASWQRGIRWPGSSDLGEERLSPGLAVWFQVLREHRAPVAGRDALPKVSDSQGRGPSFKGEMWWEAETGRLAHMNSPVSESQGGQGAQVQGRDVVARLAAVSRERSRGARQWSLVSGSEGRGPRFEGEMRWPAWLLCLRGGAEACT